MTVGDGSMRGFRVGKRTERAQGTRRTGGDYPFKTIVRNQILTSPLGVHRIVVQTGLVLNLFSFQRKSVGGWCFASEAAAQTCKKAVCSLKVSLEFNSSANVRG